jgi:hypothetical protein
MTKTKKPEAPKLTKAQQQYNAALDRYVATVSGSEARVKAGARLRELFARLPKRAEGVA